MQLVGAPAARATPAAGEHLRRRRQGGHPRGVHDGAEQPRIDPEPVCAGAVTKFQRYCSPAAMAKVERVFPISAERVPTHPHAAASPPRQAAYGR